MGLGKFFKSIVSPAALADEIIHLQIAAYGEAKKLYPGADPHVLLNHAWVSRMAARGAADPALPETHQKGFVVTWPFALLDYPYNARALGLYVLNEERPDITKALLQYAREFDSLMEPIGRLTKANQFFPTYERKNPNMAYKTTRQFDSGWIFGPKTETKPNTLARSSHPMDIEPPGGQVRIEVDERPVRCLRCDSSPVAEIIYGTPHSINLTAIDAGEVVMGGSIVRHDSPEWRCIFCGQNYHKPRSSNGDEFVTIT